MPTPQRAVAEQPMHHGWQAAHCLQQPALVNPPHDQAHKQGAQRGKEGRGCGGDAPQRHGRVTGHDDRGGPSLYKVR